MIDGDGVRASMSLLRIGSFKLWLGSVNNSLRIQRRLEQLIDSQPVTFWKWYQVCWRFGWNAPRSCAPADATFSLLRSNERDDSWVECRDSPSFVLPRKICFTYFFYHHLTCHINVATHIVEIELFLFLNYRRRHTILRVNLLSRQRRRKIINIAKFAVWIIKNICRIIYLVHHFRARATNSVNFSNSFDNLLKLREKKEKKRAELTSEQDLDFLAD